MSLTDPTQRSRKSVACGFGPGDDDSMIDVDGSDGRPRWHWEKRGPSRLFAACGTEFFLVDSLSRVEVERLLALEELDVVEIGCGTGVVSWVGPADAQRWRRVEPQLADHENYPQSRCSGEYRAELWRAADGRHVMVFNEE